MSQPTDVTLESCAEEPIHIPGSIQSHGFLIIINEREQSVLQVSENIETLIGEKPKNLIGDTIHSLFDSETAKKIADRLEAVSPEKEDPITFRIKNASKHDEYLLEIVKREGHFVLDIEPNLEVDLELNYFYHNLRGLVERISHHDVHAEQNIYEQAVAKMRNLTGFDRVMLYRFDSDYNGQVMAESKTETLNSYLHQHFPESDIPKQARALYLQNPLRLIADVNSDVSYLYPREQKYDLSQSSLRSVSPMHIQYLKNMKVGASMSVSIITDGKLSGLIACHHYSAKYVPFKIRQAAAFLGQIISYLLNAIISVKVNLKEGMARELNGILTERLLQEGDLEKTLKKEVPRLLKLVNADGVAWKMGENIQRFGSVPTLEGIRQIATFFWKHTKAQLEYHTHQLSHEDPALSKYAKKVSGILALPLSKQDDFYLIWFRKEMIETKNWGGKPEKVIEFLDDGSHRLMPRSSFTIWKENVREKSKQWDPVEVSIALRFRNSLMNYVVVRAERIKKMNIELEKRVKIRTKELNSEVKERRKTERMLKKILKEAQQSNEDLEQFAYIASHDLQEPLRKIQTFGDRFQDMNQGNLSERSQDYLARMMAAAGRMQTLIQNLLSYSRVNTRAKPFEKTNLQSLTEGVLSDLQVLIEKKNAKISIALDIEIECDPGQITRLFQNLFQNAIKFSREGVDAAVEVTVAEEDENQLTIQVQDNGIGVAVGYESKIFELFSRLHGRSAYEGTGLGLAICKKIVDRHNGKIWVQSNSEEGAIFLIRLPKKH